ncbi:MAG: hypothetical protein ACI80I_002486, partial [Akkermansiaceae bacterium]
QCSGFAFASAFKSTVLLPYQGDLHLADQYQPPRKDQGQRRATRPCVKSWRQDVVLKGAVIRVWFR